MHVHIYIYRYVYIIYTHSIYIYIHASWPQSSFGVRLTLGPSLGEAVSSQDSLSRAGAGGADGNRSSHSDAEGARGHTAEGPSSGALGKKVLPARFLFRQLPLPGWTSRLGQGSLVPRGPGAPPSHLCSPSRAVGCGGTWEASQWARIPLLGIPALHVEGLRPSSLPAPTWHPYPRHPPRSQCHWPHTLRGAGMVLARGPWRCWRSRYGKELCKLHTRPLLAE